MSGIFQQVMYELGVKQINSSAYHPESQDALERFHASLKTMIRAYVEQHEKDWDVGLPLLMFAARESEQESLGFSPFDLVFGHHVRGPLNPFVTSPGDLRDLGSLFRYEARRSPGLIA